MNLLDLASVLRRVEAIAANARTVALINAGDALSITLMRMDALADDLRKGLHSFDQASGEESQTAAPAGSISAPAETQFQGHMQRSGLGEDIIENWEPKHG